ncbi:MFS transporter [Phytohabitans kaempferiae]|uniref:MFS transporter n=1 Tax=Phytohabitans kaempferiae TaxID=1620943 RepID=A0ABV6MI47_9ACTN
MTSAPADAPPARDRVLLDLSPLTTNKAFRRLWLGTAVASIGEQMTVMTVGLQVYALTGSTFAVAMVAGTALIPMMFVGLYAGTLADRLDRRRLALGCTIVSWLSIGGITAHASLGGDLLWLLYGLTLINSVAGTAGNITRRAIVPRLLPRHLLPAAGALNGINLGIMTTVGPLLAAAAVTTGGFTLAYWVDLVLHTAAFLGIYSLPAILPDHKPIKNAMHTFKEGIAFLASAANTRFALLLDLVAMTLAQPRVLFPALGASVLGGGATTVGVLTAGSAAGTILSGIFSGRLGKVRYHGRAIVRSTHAYAFAMAAAGAVLLGYGLLPDPGEIARPVTIGVLTLVLVLTGVTDNIATIFRMTMLQSAVPDHLRGRVQGVFSTVVQGGPRLGGVLTGAVATATAAWSPLLFGGLTMTLLIWLLARGNHTFHAYDGENPTP